MCWPCNKGRAALAALLALALLFGPATAQTPPPPAKVEAVRGEQGAELSLRWPEGVTVEHEIQGRDLTLRFSRPIGDAPVESIPERLQGWVDNVLYGYDSMLLVLSPGATATVESAGGLVRVDFAPVVNPPRTAEEKQEQVRAEQRLDYFRGLALAESGRLFEARAVVRDLAGRAPGDAEVIELLANLNERIGLWREAVRAYDRALEISPDDGPLIEAKARLLREFGPFVQGEFDVFHVQNADTQRVYRLSGRQELPNGTTLLPMVEHRRVGINEVRLLDGALAAFHGARTRAELAITHDWGDLDVSRAALYVGPENLGLGVAHSVRWERGKTTAGLDWARPTFDFVEAIVGGGRRDRVFLQHEAALGAGFTMEAVASFNRYGLSGASDLGTTVEVDASLNYVLNDAGPFVMVSYLFDAMYVPAVADRTDALGNAYSPIPLQRREVHSAQVSVEDSLTDYLRYTVRAGYAYDRFNVGAPFGAVGLAWEPLPNLEIGLRASYTRNTARGTADAVQSAGGYVIWRH